MLCVIFGFAFFGLLAVGEALLADMTPQDPISTVFGVNFTVNFTCSIILSSILGIIADQCSFDAGFILLSALMPLSIPLLLKIKTKPTQQKQCPTFAE